MWFRTYRRHDLAPILPCIDQETSVTIIPRPEYPTPQFERANWTNLNGTWEFAFDDANAGLTEGWANLESLPLRILVPFPYQCEMSGINDKSIHEVVWYGKNLEFQSDWRGQDLLLHFGAVDYETAVFVNGQRVGG